MFLSLGTMVAVITQKRAKAFGYALFLWFFFVLFCDLLVNRGSFLIKVTGGEPLDFSLLFGNPADMVRVSALAVMGGTSTFGAAGALVVKFLGGTISAALPMISALLVYAVGPLVFANRVLRGRDI